jgi:hypothetical protein
VDVASLPVLREKIVLPLGAGEWKMSSTSMGPGKEQRMVGTQTLPWPQRLGYGAVIGFVSAGALLFWSIVLDLLPSTWTRYTLASQVVALLIAYLFLRVGLAHRLVLYPLLLGCLIYLWDTTLPPPTLPEGIGRHLLVRLLLIGLLADTVRRLHRKPQPPLVTSPVRDDLIQLTRAARLLQTTPQALQERLQQLGWDWVLLDGEAYLSIEALVALIEHEEARPQSNCPYCFRH